MEAVSEETAPQLVSAQLVANAFVQQYYQILHQSPGLVFRFYQDASKLGRPEDDDSMSITTTMSAINAKILALNYGELRAEIKSVDAQESYNGGVHVLVTGYLTGKDSMVRNFSQTFFLAPQDTGYFVLNDIFRYVENNNQQDRNRSLINDVETLATSEQTNASPVEENLTLVQILPEEATGGEVNNPHGNEEVSPLEEEVSPLEEEVPVAEVVDEVQDQSQPVVESIDKPEEALRKSYAFILMNLPESPVPFSSPVAAPRKAVTTSHEQLNLSSVKATEKLVSSGVIENGNDLEAESEGYSIYIRGLPFNATPSMLEEVFRKFGSIKRDGIQVRNNRQQGFCFGFVEFEVASAVEKAIEASPITISGRQAVVEEKRSTNSRANNRGRISNGGGLGYRNEGLRGRGNGNYGGGRGYGRSDINGKADFGNRDSNRGGFSNRGRDGYQRAGSMGSTGGRVNRASVVDGTVQNMAPRVSAIA